MYKILYRKHGEKDWQCLGAYAEQMVAVEALDRFEQSILGKDCEFKMAREGEENDPTETKEKGQDGKID